MLLFIAIFILFPGLYIEAKEYRIGIAKMPIYAEDRGRGILIDLIDAIGSHRIDLSLKKLMLGRIDAYIFADNVTDAYLRRNSYYKLKRKLFGVYEVKMIIAKRKRGGG